MKKKVPKAPSTHARLAPSAFKGYEICPSYVSDSEETKASGRGTMLHGVLEEKVHDEVELDHALKDVNLEEGDLHQLWLILEYLQPFLIRAKADKFTILKEQQLDLTPLGIDGCTHGTADLTILAKKLAAINLFDYKMGWWEVDDAEYNIQVALYVLGLFFKYPWAELITAHVLQPARDEVSVHEFRRADVPGMLLRGRTIAARVNESAGKVFNPVVDNCLWCDNKANCGALHKMALKAVNHGALVLPDNVDLNLESFSNVDAAGAVYDFADLIAKWAKGIKYKITQMAVDGEEVPGHDLREVSGKRIIVDPEGAYEVLRDKYDVTLSEFLAASDPSITKLLKAAGSKAEHGQMGKRQLAASGDLMGAGVVTSSSPSAYLVRIKTKEN